MNLIEEGIYWFDQMDVYFGVLGCTNCTIFYPLDKLKHKQYRILDEPGPLIFETPANRISLTDLVEREDEMVKVGELDEIIYEDVIREENQAN